MSFREHLKDMAESYFISVTLINVAVFATGIIFRPEDKFGYDALLMPLIYGALTVIPGLVMYSKKELTIKQMIVRKAIQLLMDIAIIIGVVFGGSELTGSNIAAAASVAASIVIVFVLVHIICWLLDKRTAAQLTEQLNEFQKRNSESAQ